jgi:hypothetical protein
MGLGLGLGLYLTLTRSRERKRVNNPCDRSHGMLTRVDSCSRER